MVGVEGILSAYADPENQVVELCPEDSSVNIFSLQNGHNTPGCSPIPHQKYQDADYDFVFSIPGSIES